MKKLVTIALMLFLFGCANAFVVNLIPEEYPPKPDDYQIAILLEKPTKKYKAIAIIEVSDCGSLKGCVNMLKKEARKLGADAIMEIRDSSEIVGSGTFPIVFVGETRRVTATVIVFEE